jgi:hypothetical protein
VRDGTGYVAPKAAVAKNGRPARSRFGHQVTVLRILQRLKPQHSVLQVGLKRILFEINPEPLPPRRE